ncbi:MAG TPA: hypothetical protein VIL49_09860, partial [Capillimicrobium sp.]
MPRLHPLAGPADSDDLARLDAALDDGGVDAPTRRSLLRGAAVGAAALGAGTALGAPAALAAPASIKELSTFLATSEAFGTTFLTEAIRRAPGTPSAQFADVAAAAVTAEFDHLRALRPLGGRPAVTRFWI